jgi:hypothetical protein
MGVPVFFETKRSDFWRDILYYFVAIIDGNWGFVLTEIKLTSINILIKDLIFAFFTKTFTIIKKLQLFYLRYPKYTLFIFSTMLFFKY